MQAIVMIVILNIKQEEIGDWAVGWCETLENIGMPNADKVIKWFAVQTCKSLMTVLAWGWRR